jgi:hypothetical protein
MDKEQSIKPKKINLYVDELSIKTVPFIKTAAL